MSLEEAVKKFEEFEKKITKKIVDIANDIIDYINERMAMQSIEIKQLLFLYSIHTVIGTFVDIVHDFMKTQTFGDEKTYQKFHKMVEKAKERIKNETK